MTTIGRHPDYAAIMRAVVEQDHLAQGSMDDPLEAQVQCVLGSVVDHESIRLASADRANGLLDRFAELVFLYPEVALAALWTDAFVAGVRFQQAGGHTEQPPEE